MLVHLDDFLTLRSFHTAIVDECNDGWPGGVVGEVFGAGTRGLASLQTLVSSATGEQPNPRVKHRHVGLRGIDVYRYGTVDKGPLCACQGALGGVQE